MQNIIIEKPYQFISPHRGNWWPSFIQFFNLYTLHLKKHDGVVGYELRDEDRLRASLREGHGIMLAPNHCRTADPLVLGWLAKAVGTHVFAMASWHLFNSDRFTTFAIRKMGAFSVNREGVDRQAINTAIEILEHAERPLIVFPEGATSRTNDHLHALLDGVAFIARAAAKRRDKHGAGKVVIHPIAIKYLYQGNIEVAADEVLTEIEHRLSWDRQHDLTLLERIMKVGYALLSLKEIEHFGRTNPGPLRERLDALIDGLLGPLEQEYFGEIREGKIVPRVKALRIQVLPDMVHNRLDASERQRRWRQLAKIYLAQQIACYPPDYLANPTVDRILETIERYEDDLNNKARVHGHLKAIIQVGEAIEVSPTRDRKAEVDPIMVRLERELNDMLEVLAQESPRFGP